MGRPRSPEGTIENLEKTLRTGLLIDGLLHQSRLDWVDIDALIRGQYESDQAPSKDVVRKYFRLELVPTVEVVRGRPSWPAMVTLCFPATTELFFSPLLDLLFGRHASPGQAGRNRVFFPPELLAKAQVEDPDQGFKVMSALNRMMLKKLRGRPELQDSIRPLRRIHKVMLRMEFKVASRLFKIGRKDGYRHMRPISEELDDLGKVKSLDSLGATYGLLLEAIELADFGRFHAARSNLLERLEVVDELPECRRVAPILKLVIANTVKKQMPVIYSSLDVDKLAIPESWQGSELGVDTFAPPEVDRPASSSLEFFLEPNLSAKEVLNGVVRHLEDGQNNIELKELWEVETPSVLKPRSEVKRRFKNLVMQVRLEYPGICEWRLGSALALQRSTRLVLIVPLKSSVKLIHLTYDFLSGHSVVDRQMLQTPWVEALRSYAAKDVDVHQAVKDLSLHLGFKRSSKKAAGRTQPRKAQSN